MKDTFTITERLDDCFYDGVSYTKATVTIYSLYGLGSIVFKTPLVIDILFENDLKSGAVITYDFGMDCDIPITRENNCNYDYIPNPENDPVIAAISAVKFDLQHAFFHCDVDPNYRYLHWALRAILHERVILTEEWL